MNRFNYKKNKRRILFFSFNYYPDQSAGAIRSELLIKKINEIDKKCKIFIFCSRPVRYGQIRTSKQYQKKTYDSNIKILRLWIPFLGQSPLQYSISYAFFFIQALFLSFFIRPNIIFATSAKLFTAFLASLSSKFTGAKLFIDIRDTFSDNYFYFYRWDKRVTLVSLFLLIENFILRSSHSINIVSDGFKEAFYGCQEIIKKRKIKVTNFTNGIALNKVQMIKNIFKKNKKKNLDSYKIIYAGNIGEAQDLKSLMLHLNEDKKILRNLIKSKIKIMLYGSGSQLFFIKKLIEKDKLKKESLLSEVFYYEGLISREEIFENLFKADCLLLNLGLYKSLSMVIPTKLFEYCATPLPIIFSASGFSKDFIMGINGTIHFDNFEPKSFLEAINKSRNIIVNVEKRNKFLKRFDTDLIYKKFAKHLLDY